jgi:hypothetical protein
VKNRFQSLPFKCNLHRYTVAAVAVGGLSLPGGVRLLTRTYWLSSIERCFLDRCKINVEVKSGIRPYAAAAARAVNPAVVVGLCTLNQVDP